MNTLYLGTINLEVPFSYIIFFLGSVNFQCMFSLVNTVYCQKQPPYVFCKKNILKKFANFTGKHLQVCNFVKKRLQHRNFPVSFKKFLRTPILKNIYQLLLLYCTRTTRCYLPVLLFIQYLLSHHHCYCR